MKLSDEQKARRLEDVRVTLRQTFGFQVFMEWVRDALEMATYDQTVPAVYNSATESAQNAGRIYMLRLIRDEFPVDDIANLQLDSKPKPETDGRTADADLSDSHN